MNKKRGDLFILVINVIGVLYLIACAIPYLTHDTRVLYPNSMLPAERWDDAGVGMAVGLIPLIIVNLLAFRRVGKEKIKKPARLLFLLPSVLCLVLVAHYFTTGALSRAESTRKPMINVAIKYKDDAEVQYRQIYNNGSMKVLEEPVKTGEIYYIADYHNFASEIKNNRVVNTVIGTVLAVNNGTNVKAEEYLTNLLNAIAETVSHNILEARLFEAKSGYYVAVQTNVNWQSPCDFYRYNEKEGTLTHICTWQNADVLGVAEPAK